MNHAERIIVALDVDTREEALDLVQKLRGKVGLFKVGSQLFTSEGPALVREILDSGENVFLDLKFHDIPNTVAKAALSAVRLGVSMMTLHAGGGRRMMTSVREALMKAALPGPRPLTLAVTVLTSMGDQDLKETGCPSHSLEQVVRLARLAHQSGMDGIVASPVELPVLRQEFGKAMILVTPGIRPAGSDLNDQIRIATPSVAIQAGADYLVVGRSITASADPVRSLESILEELKSL
jgi:orotidine-5'-phosphate decarboxylase